MARPLCQTTRTKAVRAAAALLAATGLQGFSVDGVVRSSGVAKTTLYRHFGSSSDLLLAAIEEHLYDIVTPDHGTLREDLLDLVGQYMAVFKIQGRVQLALDLLCRASQGGELREVHDMMTSRRVKPLQDVLARAMDRGDIPTIDMDLAVSFVQGPFLGRTFIHLRPLSDQEIPEFTDLILKGLGERPA